MSLERETTMEPGGLKSDHSLIERGQAIIDQQPPPYESLTLQASSKTMYFTTMSLRCIFVTLSREHTLPSVKVTPQLPNPYYCSLDREAERMRNFMLYTLAIDYGLNLGIVFTRDDREHFVAMGKWFVHLYQANSETRLSEDDVNRAVPYLRDLVYRPASTYIFPLETFLLATIRYVRAIDHFGEYRACTTDVLLQDGIHRLEEKLYFDDRHLVPRLARDCTMREAMRVPVHAMLRQYFASIGLQSPSPPYPFCDTRCMSGSTTKIPFTLTAYGKGIEAEREKKGRRTDWLRRLWRLISTKQELLG